MTRAILAAVEVDVARRHIARMLAGEGMAVTDALALRELSKTFKAPAVDRLDLVVRQGELSALLGPNGAGKTTTLRMVAGLLKPDAGEISVFGIDALADPIAAKRLIAWAPDEPMLYDQLTPMEYLEFVAGLWGVEPRAARERAEALLRFLDLWDVRGQRCEGFSRGMKQKAALAGALIHEPRLLILDEPLTGLDAAMARQVKDLLQQRVRAGGTVILTTHILEVAERMADRIGIMQHGRLLAEGTMSELRALAGGAGGALAGGAGGALEDVFLEITGAGSADAA
jgi:ABC-2 type transport system ATP-binding protein